MVCSIFDDFTNALKAGGIVLAVGLLVIAIFAIKSVFDHFDSKRRQKEHDEKERKEMGENLEHLKQAARNWDLPTLYKELKEVEQEIESLEDCMRQGGGNYADKTVYLLTLIDIDSLREFRVFLKTEIAKRSSYY